MKSKKQQLSADSMHGFVRLNYDAVAWTAERLKTSSYIQFKNEANPSDGMVWAVPDDTVAALDWSIRHAGHIPTRAEMLNLLAVVGSYRALLLKPAKEQRAIARALREFLVPNTGSHRPSEPEANEGSVG